MKVEEIAEAVSKLPPDQMATLAWIEASAFEKMPHTKPLRIDQSLLIDGVYVVPKA
jgi:hypothetical protein